MQMSVDRTAQGMRPTVETEISTELKPWVTPKIRIGWISVSRLTRECMSEMIVSAQPSLEIIPFDTPADCIALPTKPLELIIYHSRGGGATDLQAVTELRRALPRIKILVLSDSVAIEPAVVQRILAGGTSGFMLTVSDSLDMLLSAIRLVSSGGTFVSREFFMADRLPKTASVGTGVHHMPQITQRERAVLELIKHGKPNKVIAQELGLSVCTVKIHARNLIRKLGAVNRIQAAVNASKFL